MNNITLVCTDHKERDGLLKSSEFLKIIENISPDIIFEEIHVDLFNGYYDGTYLPTLETKAIQQYLQKNPIPHIPVDRFDLNEIRHEYFAPIYTTIDRVNPYHHILLSMHIELAQEMGFEYLNSDRCSNISELKRFWAESNLKKINNDELTNRYKKWIDNQENREREMLKNIYNYKDLSKYNNGLFWIGAEHRRSIINKIPEFEATEKVKLNWIFYK